MLNICTKGSWAYRVAYSSILDLPGFTEPSFHEKESFIVFLLKFLVMSSLWITVVAFVLFFAILLYFVGFLFLKYPTNYDYDPTVNGQPELFGWEDYSIKWPTIYGKRILPISVITPVLAIIYIPFLYLLILFALCIFVKYCTGKD